MSHKLRIIIAGPGAFFPLSLYCLRDSTNANFRNFKKWTLFFFQDNGSTKRGCSFEFGWVFDSSSHHQLTFIPTLSNLLSMLKSHKSNLKKKQFVAFWGGFEASFIRSSRIDIEWSPNFVQILSSPRLVCLINPSPELL